MRKMTSLFRLLSINCLLVTVFLVDSSFQRSSLEFKHTHVVHSASPIRQDFDYLIFRQIWPASTCLFPGKNTCSIAKNITTWVIHGLWPSIKSEIGPQFCNKSLPFNFNTIKTLLPLLLEFWPNLYTNTPLDSFWKHEWEKHGTCALNLPQIRSEFDYFNVSLNLRDLYDFGPVLSQLSILPSDTLLYDANKIRFAIKSILKVEPLLVCYVLKDSDVQYFSQMQVCLSKDFQLVDCSFQAVELANIVVNNEPQETQCQDSMPIHYPTIHYARVLSAFKNSRN